MLVSGLVSRLPVLDMEISGLVSRLPALDMWRLEKHVPVRGGPFG